MSQQTLDNYDSNNRHNTPRNTTERGTSDVPLIKNTGPHSSTQRKQPLQYIAATYDIPKHEFIPEHEFPDDVAQILHATERSNTHHADPDTWYVEIDDHTGYIIHLRQTQTQARITDNTVELGQYRDPDDTTVVFTDLTQSTTRYRGVKAPHTADHVIETLSNHTDIRHDTNHDTEKFTWIHPHDLPEVFTELRENGYDVVLQCRSQFRAIAAEYTRLSTTIDEVRNLD